MGCGIRAAAGVERLRCDRHDEPGTRGVARTPDQTVTLDELLAHVEELAAAVDIPLSVDSERCFADTPDGVADTVERLAMAGASGCSIEDYDPGRGAIDPVEIAAERVAAAAEAAHRHGLVLTARPRTTLRNHRPDDTIARLSAYRRRGRGRRVRAAPGGGR